MVENERKDDNTGDSGGKSPKKLRVLLRTYGCQMNDRDSEALAGLFLTKGYSLVEDFNEADVILVNTCSVRGHAENRALSFLGSLKKINELRTTNYKLRIIGLIGCMAQNRGAEVFQKMPHINLICGPANLDKIPAYVDKILADNNRIIDLEYQQRDDAFYHSLYRVDPSFAQVIISVGCSNYCSYCVVPFVRGELYLRKPQDILDEIKRNVDLGIKKITLLGQNVNDYYFRPQTIDHRLQTKNQKTKNEILRGISFIKLLEMVTEVNGVEEVSFVTNNPQNTSTELFEFMGQSPKVKKHLHLPFQSGSSRILKLMNRKYSKEDYLNLAEEYKRLTSGTLSTDIIVGFPGETEEDFLDTKDVIEKVQFRYSYIFKYSPRPNTAASKLADDVPEEVKRRRHKILLDLQKGISSI